MRRTTLVVAAMQPGCSEAAETRSEGALSRETAEYCAAYGAASGRYEIRIDVLGEEDRGAYGLASVRISEVALTEHPGVAFEVACESPAVGPSAAYVIPRDPTSVVLPLVIVLPDTTPFSAVCTLETYSDAPARSDDCVPWGLGARVEARGLEALTIDVVEL